MFSIIKRKTISFIRKSLEKRAKKFLQSKIELWDELSDYAAKSSSIGCSYTDLAEIYKYIKEKKPKEILECGTGISTIVMALALKENGDGHITSMESEENYFEIAASLLPVSLSKYVEIIFSPVIEDSYSLFRGCRYKDIPLEKQYDFVFVDGPSYVAPSDGTITFNFDYLYILLN
jgi:predicted O-methyltransferase YrrM